MPQRIVLNVRPSGIGSFHKSDNPVQGIAQGEHGRIQPNLLPDGIAQGDGIYRQAVCVCLQLELSP